MKVTIKDLTKKFASRDKTGNGNGCRYSER